MADAPSRRLVYQPTGISAESRSRAPVAWPVPVRMLRVLKPGIQRVATVDDCQTILSSTWQLPGGSGDDRCAMEMAAIGKAAAGQRAAALRPAENVLGVRRATASHNVSCVVSLGML
jgi:hypothetical protein